MDYLDSFDDGVVLVIFVTILVLYFIPWLVASKRNHNNEIPIFIVNFFLGWSGIAWVLSLAWAFSNDVSTPKYEAPINEKSGSTPEPKLQNPQSRDE